mmetsp:Transcript_24510/g.40864  ORF Transcript_24510/g.40864 Transcript_24510/m.40864 type:complete len:296 (+) Transcript_24510:65-952(+)|eukprot:CAMPEP_0174992332 /NCGR_PEP_ID=MMETSP0004_2-20121128/22449_1 /TAXON_ID=420556 /ORGANISM="Ochromonas sp., Strain CCMP1393" /LENGTH=295 /DNA_ID=CAMNT_0016246301 /DNA_START=38 /DNA_END=925 /DNA_ORIENTATION=+
MSVTRGNSLLLGVVFATEQVPKRGQEYRDRVRCEAMEAIGFQVRTLDNKHSDEGLSKHCTANFSDTRRMMRSMDAKWENETFDHVILDYFFSPVGWARHRWTDPLFTNTLPTLAKCGKLSKGGKVWLPNLQCIQESLDDFEFDLLPYYTINKVANPKLNPLYEATDYVEQELLMCPDALTNETQLRPLDQERPFYYLQLRSEFLPLTPIRTPSKKTPLPTATTTTTTTSKSKRAAQQQQGRSTTPILANDSEDSCEESGRGPSAVNRKRKASASIEAEKKRHHRSTRGLHCSSAL